MELQSNNALPFTHDFIFSLVMRNPKICKGILERILPEEEFSDIEIIPNENSIFSDSPFTTETQKNFKFDLNSHGVRFDAFMRSENMWAEIEMQTYSQEDIGKRSRYYHANMDIEFLESGKPYKDLKKSYVIFICTFDYKKKGEPIYHYYNYDVLTETYLNDDSHTIILNTACPLNKVPDKLKPLYAYINDSHSCDDEFIKELDSCVQKYNSPEWRQKQMTLEHIIEREKEIIAGKINRLNALLIESGRIDDLKKSTEDHEYQEKLFEEFGL